MAIWHFRVEIIGRSSGKSAVAAAAYRAGESLYSEHTDLQFDYTKKRDISFTEILLPSNAPEWMKDREKLWNGVEAIEKRKDSTLAREIRTALPIEFSLEQKKDLLREYINQEFIPLGMVADYSIHNDDGHNPHAHILLTTRPVIENGFGKKERVWNEKRLFEQWQEQWAAITNKHLAINGIDQKISHLSYAAQGIDLEPTIHRGYIDHFSDEQKALLDRFERSQSIQERNYHRLLSNPTIALDYLTRHESVFNHQELARFVNVRTQTADEFAKLKLAIESCTDLVSLGTGLDGKTYYTSQSVLKQERDLLERAQRLSKSNVHQLNPDKLKFILAQRTVSEEQKAAFNHILSEGDLSLIVGFAGTGKSYLMDAVREAYQSQGYRVLGTALSGKAADGLSRSAGIDSHTIARYLLDWENDRNRLDHKSVLIIDEIGMVGTRQLQLLLAEAERVGAKVIGCGDPEQIPPVEAGCPFRFLLERLPHIFLQRVIRQKIDWQRQATVELSTRQHGKALDRYRENEFIHEHSNREEALKTLVSRWYVNRLKNPQQTTAMIAYRNVDVLAMNLLARDYLKQTSVLGDESLEVETNAFGKLVFQTGDRIVCLRNENSFAVRNGLIGTVEAINGTYITINLDRGDRVTIDTHLYRDLGFGYAISIHKSQGETLDKSFVLATPHLDRFLTNVAMDRHRVEVEMHYGKDDFESYDNLQRTLSRGESKVLAVEFAQARGLDYELLLDEAAQVESKTNFNIYHQKIIAESQPIQHTLAETYLTEQCHMTNLNVNTLRFHPAVWEQETQNYMPALIAKAVGYGEDKQLVEKGAQITFLNEMGKKAALEHPVTYSGSSDAIVMLQKPAQQNDARWFVAADIESALAIREADSAIRVACLATQDQFDKNPLQGQGGKSLVFCADNKTPQMVIDKATAVFTKKEFQISIAKPGIEMTFADLLKKQGKDTLKQFLDKPTSSIAADKEVLAVINEFVKLDKERHDAENQPYAFHRTMANEAIEKYAMAIGKEPPLMIKIQIAAPELHLRIVTILEQELEIDL